MRIAWIDCSAGASGDMLLGAFLDAGADPAQVAAAVAAVDDSLSITTERTSRHQISAAKASVRVHGALHPETLPLPADSAAELGHDHSHDHGHDHGSGHGHGHGHGGDGTRTGHDGDGHGTGTGHDGGRTGHDGDGHENEDGDGGDGTGTRTRTEHDGHRNGDGHQNGDGGDSGDGHGNGGGDGQGDADGQGPGQPGVREVAAGAGPTRTWAEVRSLIEAADLGEAVRDRALDTFARLARAEAAAHGVEPDQVHFHEVGALDAIADIVGVAAAAASLRLDRVVVSTIALGGGRQVRGQHGGIPVPGPAVLALLAEAGAPVVGGTAPYEMTTPTGAALLASLADEFGLMPPMRIRRTGVGAGGRDPVEVPNVVRVVVGESIEQPARGEVHEVVQGVVYETNVDDLDPRIWPQVLVRLLAAGAADAWLTPILMKKGRPAHTLSVLVGPVDAAAVRSVILTETSAIGLREYGVSKHAADREFVEVEVDGQRIHLKIARYGGQVVNVQPEYDDVAAAATAVGKPVKAILAKAVAAGHDLWS